jgi:hypothetical protein
MTNIGKRKKLEMATQSRKRNSKRASVNGGNAGYPLNYIDVQLDNKKEASILSLKSISEYESEFESESLSDSMDSKMIRNKSAGVERAGLSNRNIFVEPNPPVQP